MQRKPSSLELHMWEVQLNVDTIFNIFIELIN